MTLTFASLATASGMGSELRGLSAPVGQENLSVSHFVLQENNIFLVKFHTHIVPEGTGLTVSIIVVVGYEFEAHLWVRLRAGQLPFDLWLNSVTKTENS